MKKQTKKQPFYRKKVFLWVFGVIISVIVMVLIVFRVSPWPGALIIRAVFESNDVKMLQALQKHQPKAAVTSLLDQPYKQGDKDALLDVYFPESSKNANSRLPTIIWTHGGAWVSGSKANVAPYYKLLAAEGFTVIAANYSLAPEKSYPTAVHQLNQLYGYIQQRAADFNSDTSKIILAGDSAGSQLSSQMAALITNPAYAQEVGVTPNLTPAQLKGVILNCGIYIMHDLAHSDPTIPKIVGWGTDVTIWAYAGTRDFSAPIIKQMSAYYHVTNNFPPTFITGGNGDPLTKVQSMPFAEKLQNHNVAVTKLFYPDDHTPSLPHEYQFNLDNTDGVKALQAIVAFAKNQTK